MLRSSRLSVPVAIVALALSPIALFAQQSPTATPNTTPNPIPEPGPTRAIPWSPREMDIDPTEKIDINGWWTNGKELLRVQPDGAFQWWDQPNRFRPPSKIGRWDRQNYRTFWLEPYVDKRNPGVMPPRIRAPMRRTDGKLMIDVGSALSLVLVKDAPGAPEDLYVGRWSGPGGSLTLSAQGRYELQASAGSSADDALVSRTSHAGTWTFDGQYIMLFSSGSAQNPIICTVVDRTKSATNGATTRAQDSKHFEALTTPIGELKRIETPKPLDVPPAIPAATPAARDSTKAPVPSTTPQ